MQYCFAHMPIILACITGLPHSGHNLLVDTCTVCYQVEKKIAEELREHGLLAVPDQPLPRGPDYADLDKLTYLTCVIKEAMRVHSVCHHSQKPKSNVVTASC